LLKSSSEHVLELLPTRNLMYGDEAVKIVPVHQRATCGLFIVLSRKSANSVGPIVFSAHSTFILPQKMTLIPGLLCRDAFSKRTHGGLTNVRK
jgi:hypothetical protein